VRRSHGANGCPLAYIGWHEPAALRQEGYSRISNAISELHFTGIPSKSLLDPWQGWVDSALLAAFGIGIWLSAPRASQDANGGVRAIRTQRPGPSACSALHWLRAAAPSESLALARLTTDRIL
jgi:hypothetical protein